MTDTLTPPADRRPSPDPLPSCFADGGTFLLACAGDPAAVDVDLRILGEYGSATDTAFIVTTTQSAVATVATIDERYEKATRPALGFVDTTSEHQSVSSLFGGTPTIFTPDPGDLERLVLALSELTDRYPPGPTPRHLIVRSLTPILQATATDRLCHVLGRIEGLRTQTGLCLLGIDHTAHDSDTLDALRDIVDGVLWITPTGEGAEFAFQHARSPETTTPPSPEDGDA